MRLLSGRRRMANIGMVDILRHFFVFNPEYGAKEGEEHKKLLFYYPKTDSLDIQVQNVGYCEAIVKFTQSFTGDDAPLHEVNTEKELQISCKLENDFFIGAAFIRSSASDRRYHLHARTLQNVLLRSYRMFRLFFGTFTDVLQRNGGQDGLKERLEYFFTRYLASLKLASIPLLDALDWVSYMKLDSTNYLKAQTLISRTCELFPCVSHYVFLYSDRLLLHNLSKSNLSSVYRYLVQNLLPLSLRSELQPDRMAGRSSNTFSHGKFITGFSAEAGSKSPSIFLLRQRDDVKQEGNDEELDDVNQTQKLDEHVLVVYRALNATLAILVPIEQESALDQDFFRNFDAAIGSQMAGLASQFVEFYGKERDLDPAIHSYIYYNAINLALTTTSNEHSKNKSVVTPELAGALCDFRQEITGDDYFGDIVAKADGEYWLAAKRAGQRELYIVLYQKNASLSDVHEEIKRFCTSMFENVFLSE